MKPGAWFRAALAAALLAGLAAAEKPKPLSVENRLAIVRVLSSEYATAKQPLPASQKIEEALVVTPPGTIKEDKLRDDLAKRGAAVHTGAWFRDTACGNAGT